MKKLVPIAIIVVLIVAYFATGLNKLLSFENLKASLDSLIELKSENPLFFTAAFFLVYLLSAALSLPIITPLSLAAGAIFGLLEGIILVSFGSSIGASLAFLTSRFVLRDAIEARFGDKLAPINAGIEKDGAFYLFSLRLIPIFPFYLINLAMGLTKINLSTFYWVSQIGMLIGTIVYVNAGTQLANLDGLSGILSPALIASFALLGVLPWIAKFIMNIIQRARVYKGFNRPKAFERDIIVIGAGAAGLVSTYIGAAVKAKITIIEAHKMGGDCLNYGCVPSKALIKSAKIAQFFRDAEKYGLKAQAPSIDFKAVISRIHKIIAEIEPHDSAERYTKLGAEVLKGYARIIDPWRVEISLENGSKQVLTSRNIIIATGARPFIPPLKGIESTDYLTSDTLWEELAKRDKIPGRIVVLGGGPIGSELSQALARLGAKVTQIEMADRLLIREDKDVSDLAKASLERSGVDVLTGHKAIGFETAKGKKAIVTEFEGKTKKVEFDDIICAVGRSARLEGFGLEELGIETLKTLLVNEFMETKYPNILGAGDVVGPYQFTHVAAHQAWYASVNALFGNFKKFKADYRVIPWTTFIDPEIARVGLNEQEANEKKIPYDVTKYDIDDLDRAIADSAGYGFVKVLTVPGKDKIIGVTIAGEHAGEIMTEFVLAMKWGLGLNKILGTIHTYPTMSEANKYAAGEWKRKNIIPWQIKLLEKFHTFNRGQ